MLFRIVSDSYESKSLILTTNLVKLIKARHAKSERLDGFAQALTAQSGILMKFDAGLWGTLVDFMTVYSKEDISVTFKNGTEIHIR